MPDEELHTMNLEEFDDIPYETLVEQGISSLQLLTASHDRMWKLSEADWSVDQDLGEIVFHSEAANMVVTAPVQILGSLNTQDGTWLWGWANSSIEPALQRNALAMREYGERHGIEELTTRKFECDADKAWRFTALAVRLFGAQGGYRGPAGPTLVFMIFGEVRLERMS
jgi:hypothetical protein